MIAFPASLYGSKLTGSWTAIYFLDCAFVFLGCVLNNIGQSLKRISISAFEKMNLISVLAFFYILENHYTACGFVTLKCIKVIYINLLDVCVYFDDTTCKKAMFYFCTWSFFHVKLCSISWWQPDSKIPHREPASLPLTEL